MSGYCAYGSCNIFGCNCDGGCREPPQMFKDLDKNGDGHIQRTELDKDPSEEVTFIWERVWRKLKNSFRDLDSNGDGKLSPHELVPLKPLWPGLKGLQD